MKAFLAKVRCYNKCVKMAKTDAESKLKKNKREKITPEASGGTLQEALMLPRSTAAMSLTLVADRGSRQRNDEKFNLEQATHNPAITTNKRNSSRWSRDFPLATKSATTATPKNLNQKRQSSPPKGYNVIHTKHQRCADFISQWNTDSEFLVPGSRHTKPTRRKRSYTATSQLSVRVDPRKKHNQEWGYRVPKSPHRTCGALDFTRHSTSDRKFIQDTLSLVRSKLHPQEAYRKRPVMEQSSTAESTESDITPSLFDTTQDDILTCSSFTSYDHKSITTENETSTQDCSTSVDGYTMSERDATLDSEEFPVKTDYAIPEINPISILASFKNYFQADNLPELASEVSSTFRDQDTLMGSVSSDRNLECGESGSTVICSNEYTALEGLDTGSGSPRKPNSTVFQNTSATSTSHHERPTEVPDFYQELETPVQSESHSRSTVIESGPTDSTIGSKDYPQKTYTELENSHTALQTSERECAESASERDYSTIASMDYPVKSSTEFEEYAVSEIASTCDNGNWHSQPSNVMSDSCREQVELPFPIPGQVGSIPIPLQCGGFIECSPRAHRRSRSAIAAPTSDEDLNAEPNSASEQYEPSDCSSNQQPESEIPDVSPEVRGYTSSAVSLPLHAEQGSYDYDFEHSAYNAYQHIIGTAESEFQDYGPPKKCSTPKKPAKKSSMKGMFPQEGSRGLRERSVSVKSVRFSADSPSIEEPMDSEGYYHRSSSSTGYLQHIGTGYVISTGRLTRPLQSSPHRHHGKHYPPEISTPVKHDCESEHHCADECDSDRVFGSHHYSRGKLTATKVENPLEDHLAKGGSHAKPATGERETHEENFDPIHQAVKGKTLSHKAYSDTTKSHECADFESKLGETKQYHVRQKECSVEPDPRRKHEPHLTRSSVGAARNTYHAKRVGSSTELCNDDVEAGASICAARDQFTPSTYQGIEDCKESEELSKTTPNQIACESRLVATESNISHGQAVSNFNSTEQKEIGNRGSKAVSIMVASYDFLIRFLCGGGVPPPPPPPAYKYFLAIAQVQNLLCAEFVIATLYHRLQLHSCSN